MDKTKTTAQQDCAQTPAGKTHNNPLETIHTGETVCNTVSTKEREQNNPLETIHAGETVCNTVSTKEREQNTKTGQNTKTEQDTKKTRTRKNTNTMTEMVNWIEENMLAKERIRYNCLRDRIEIDDSPYPLREGGRDFPDREGGISVPLFCGVPTSTAQWGALEGAGGVGAVGVGKWRDLNERDLNEMTRQCCMERNIMVKPYEMDSVLKSHLIPTVDPLKDYLAQLDPYNPQKEGDWIQFVADMVRIKGERTPENGIPLPQAARKIEENDNGMGRETVYNTVSTQNNNCNTYNNVDGGNNNGMGSTDYMRERWNKCFRRWFLAMVESWRKEEVVNHQVLVLIGRQGIFKTTWLESLLPPCLRDYGTKFSGTFDKDDRLRIAESALINLDEIDAMTPRELNKMKALITAADINERKAFGHNKERRHRIASFCASGNRREFLSDTTGNRRWLSFEVESIDNPHEFFPFVRYDRLYAQALYCLDQLHEKYWFDAEDIAEIEEQNSDFRAMESEEELLGILFDIPAQDAQGEQVKLLTTAEISAKLVAFGNIRKPMPLNRLSAIMRRMGYEQRRSGSKRVKQWRVYERNADEINLLRK